VPTAGRAILALVYDEWTYRIAQEPTGFYKLLKDLTDFPDAQRFSGII